MVQVSSHVELPKKSYDSFNAEWSENSELKTWQKSLSLSIFFFLPLSCVETKTPLEFSENFEEGFETRIKVLFVFSY